MFDNYYSTIEYKEYVGLTDSGQPSYKNTVNIKGLRLKGQIKVSHSNDGDTTSCSIVYKTKEKIVPLSMINGREVMECVPVSGFGRDCGYLSYVK